jgi:hypothetical protein
MFYSLINVFIICVSLNGHCSRRNINEKFSQDYTILLLELNFFGFLATSVRVDCTKELNTLT